MICSAICSISPRWPSRNAVGAWSAISQRVNMIAFTVLLMAVPASAQSPLSLTAASELAARRAPTVDVGTLLAFAWFESKFQPLAIHDNTTMRSEFPASRPEAVARASALLAQNHNLDLGLCQVNSANLSRTGLTVMSAFDPGESMRAGAQILTGAYQRCLHGNADPTQREQQAALRCTASVYNTGDEQTGILIGYQSGVWRAAAHVVPAIQLAGASSVPNLPEDAVAPEPRQPPPGLEDALHATPRVFEPADGLSDALHPSTRKDTVP
jgi:type IV secretion system protein VirB1